MEKDKSVRGRMREELIDMNSNNERMYGNIGKGLKMQKSVEKKERSNEKLGKKARDDKECVRKDGWQKYKE